MRSALVVMLLVAAFAPAAPQSNDGIRWSFAFGPTMALGASRWVPQSGDPFSFSGYEPIIHGGTDGKVNLALGVAGPIGSSALRWRVDLIYNQARSAPEPNYQPCDPEAPPPESPLYICGWPRGALRDELYVGSVGLQWDAFPRSRWSPYLLTTAGAAHSRLYWNDDPGASRPNRRELSYGPTIGAGIGMRLPVWKYEGFIEARRHRMPGNVYSSNFIPLSFGVRF